MADDWRSRWEEMKTYLPSYLSPADQKQLFDQLSTFESKSSEYYTSMDLEISSGIKQGDAIPGISYVTLPITQPKKTNVIVFSNTCDIAVENKRYYPTKVMYAPIIKLSLFRAKVLEKSFPDDSARVESILETIRMQRKTDIFYLPPPPGKDDEYIVFLDSVCSSTMGAFYEEADQSEEKEFTFSQLGHYLFLLKLSIHFSRFGEGACRSAA